MAAGVATLVGCLPYEQRLELAASHRCAAAGIYAGDDGYSDCMQRAMDNIDQADQRERAMWGGIAVSGANILAQPRIPPTVIECAPGAYCP
jgi:hypothetical protein